MIIKTRPRSSCAYDILALGEVMLRLDPGEGRIRTARQFRAWEGGGEYNVARGLRRCFRQRAALVSAFVRDEVGLLLEDLILQGGVDTSLVRWRESDGIGREVRNGLNFTERGFGVRGAVGCSDRGRSAASQLRKGDVDWEHIFGNLGVRWFHTGGIFAGLSESTPEVALEAMACARRHGTVISYDLNYRPSLWKSIGGLKRCQEVNREIAKQVDVMLGNEDDFTNCLGLQVAGRDDKTDRIESAAFREMIQNAARVYPNFQAAATTLRTVHSAGSNDWGAILWTGGSFYEATLRPRMEILDRVGGGDSFASGLIYGLMELDDPRLAVEYGAAHGALAMTTPGDTSMASLAEVEKLAGGGNARVER